MSDAQSMHSFLNDLETDCNAFLFSLDKSATKEVTSDQPSNLESVPVTSFPEEMILQSTHQFLEFYHNLEDELDNLEQEKYLHFISQLSCHIQDCTDMTQGLLSLHSLLNQLDAMYVLVQSKSKELQHTSEVVLEEQAQMVFMLDKLKQFVAYFNDYEPISRLFSSTNVNVCLEDAFLPMLNRVNECILFLETKTNYKDSSLYILKYRQCMTRGLNLIKTFLLSTFKDLHASIKDKLSQTTATEQLNASLRQSLLYDKFKKVAIECRLLVKEFEEKCVNQEFNAMMKECVQFYFQTRKQLLLPILVQEAHDTMESSKDWSSNTKVALHYIQAWIQRESDLYESFFEMYEEEYISYAVQLCSVFYELIRPHILKEVKMEVLTDLFDTIGDLNSLVPSIVNTAAYHALQGGSVSEPGLVQGSSVSHMGLQGSVDTQGLHRVLSKGNLGIRIQQGELWRRTFASVLEPICQDVQQRLVFRMQMYVQQEISAFRPRDEEILIMTRPVMNKNESGNHKSVSSASGNSTEKTELGHSSGNSPHSENRIVNKSENRLGNNSENRLGNNSANGQWRETNRRVSFLSNTLSQTFSNQNLAMSNPGSQRRLQYCYGSGEWYPTVQKTLFVLAILYSATPAAVFREMAQEVLEQCRVSLSTAHQAIIRLSSGNSHLSASQTNLSAHQQTNLSASHPSTIDASLFLLKHWVYLREEIQTHFGSFDFIKEEQMLGLEQILSKTMQVVTERRMDMQTLGGLGKGWIEAAASPQITSLYSDAKQMIDEEVRKCYEDLIIDISQKTMEPILSFMLKVNALKITRQTRDTHLFAHQDQVRETYHSYMDLLQQRFKPSLHKMKNATVHVPMAGQTLFRYLKNNMIQQYALFEDWVKEHYGQTILMGSGQEMTMMIQEIWDRL